MAIIQEVRGFNPQIGENCFLAANAVVVGDVVVGNDCSIWFGAVLRGDVNSIRVGNGVNIQDGSVLHTLYEKSVIEIGDHVSVGHNVVLHGCKVEDYALIGMGAVVMDNAVVGEGAIVAAGSVVLSNTKIGAHELWAVVGQIRKDGGAGEGEGDEFQNRQKLPHVLHLVRTAGLTNRIEN